MATMNMKSYLKLYEWADRLAECGRRGEVGAGMIQEIKEKIREAYQNGFSDGKKGFPPRKMQTSRGVRGRNFSRPGAK